MINRKIPMSAIQYKVGFREQPIPIADDSSKNPVLLSQKGRNIEERQSAANTPKHKYSLFSTAILANTVTGGK